MDHLEKVLNRLASTPVHPGLEHIDESVFAGLAAHGSRAAAARSVRPLGIGVLAALALGIFSAGLSSTGPAAETPIVSLVAPHALAPSSLLLAPR